MGCFIFIISLVFLVFGWSAALPRNVIILAGQSNMVGRAGTKGSSWDGITPVESESRPEILRLNDELTWEEAREPLHRGISNNCPDAMDTQPAGIGPGMPFSNSVLRRDPAFGEIGLVPCAVGGTRLSQWSRGSCLYNRLVTRAGAAVRDGGVLRGMLWYQGSRMLTATTLRFLGRMDAEWNSFSPM